MKKALVLGAGGFIGSHMATFLKDNGYWVRGVDLKHPEYGKDVMDDFKIGDLTDPRVVNLVTQVDGEAFDEIYQFAADMGGAGYIFTGEHDANVMHNSATINLNVADRVRELNELSGTNKTTIFYSSSACMYPEYNQFDPDNPNCAEDSAYPAMPDSEYGWEKLFSERVYLAYNRNYGIPVRIARFHNIFGIEGTWRGGKEKAPAAICRKVAETPDGGVIEIWGDGEQTRSFLYVSECVKAVYGLVQSNWTGPVNIGSEEMVTINELVNIVAKIAGKTINIKHIDGPLGVRGRNSDNTLIREKLGWEYTMTLEEGLCYTYDWIKKQVENERSN